MSINPSVVFEQELIYKLIHDPSYFSSVVPYIKTKYFREVGNAVLYDAMHRYYTDTGNKPNARDLLTLIKDEGTARKEVGIEAFKNIHESTEHINKDLLKSKTEDFIRKAIHTESLILGAEGMGENNDEKLAESFKIAEEAQKVSLDEDFGTSVYDIDECVDYYQDDTMGILPNIRSFNNMMGRGFLPKTLHTFLAPPGIGKSATMSAFAVEFLKQGRDVVVFTLEMEEAEWMKRIYANLIDVPIATLETSDPEEIKRRFKEKTAGMGTLIVKEYPSYAVNALQIQNFLEKYGEKTGIKQPVCFVDYLGLMGSSRMPVGTASYEYIKSITAELRGVAQKLELVMITAHQLNRSAVDNLEAGQASVSDSAGISMFSDSMIFLLQTKEWKKLGKIKVNFEKNRMTGKTTDFTIGFDYQKMRFNDDYNDEVDNFDTGMGAYGAKAPKTAI